LRRAALAGFAAATFVLLVPVAAGAQEPDPYGGGRTVIQSPATDPAPKVVSASPAQSDSDPNSSLPLTGGDIAGLAVIGAGVVGAGIFASRLRRRRDASPPAAAS
jgi:LPXTG-motif cell wall-anchored protein